MGAVKRKHKLRLMRQQANRCAACGKAIVLGSADPYDLATLDRMRPGAANGAYTRSNLQLLCYPCNQAKGPHYERAPDDDIIDDRAPLIDPDDEQYDDA